VAALPTSDWIIDCAAIAAVTSGLKNDSRLLVEHNLIGTLHLLEKCRAEQSGFLLLSTSRVYSCSALAGLPLCVSGERLALDPAKSLPRGVTFAGITHEFDTSLPISLYGATKLSSEIMALEYGAAFQFPVWVNRCGVLAGRGQLGRADQGVISYWIYSWLRKQPLKYIGFGGRGLQVRDFLDPDDLFRLISRQLAQPASTTPRIVNVGGGLERTISLAELSQFCVSYFGHANSVSQSADVRPYDIPYYVTDNAHATSWWDWEPIVPASETLQSIARWAIENEALLASW
jgi:CDP-paratose 2-epimerase